MCLFDGRECGMHIVLVPCPSDALITCFSEVMLTVVCGICKRMLLRYRTLPFWCIYNYCTTAPFTLLLSRKPV